MFRDLLLVALVAAPTTLPADVWGIAHGGAGITLHREQGVTVEMGDDVLAGADVPALAQAFLQQYGPQTCSDILDLTVPHKGLVVHVRQHHLDASGPTFRFFVSGDADVATVTFDYAPARVVHCVYPEGEPMS